MASNNGAVVREWAMSGLGVIVRSEWDVAEDLVTGRLVRLLPQWDLSSADAMAVVSARSGKTARAQQFIALLSAALTPPPWRTSSK
jgi:DNA-binding transcriptional LysR family regulator